MVMNNKINNVKVFFDNPDNYLTNNTGISLRKIIIENILGELEKKSILDIGCGDGTSSRDYLENNNVTFLDISQSMLNAVKKSIPSSIFHNATFLNADFQEYTFNAEYDVIVCIGVLAHVEDIEGFISKMKKILKENGKIIIQITDDNKILAKTLRLLNKFKLYVFSSNKIYPYKINYITRDQLYSIFEKLNLIITQQKNYWRPYPGISKFSPTFQLKLLNFINNRNWFSRLGTELFLQVHLQNKITN